MHITRMKPKHYKEVYLLWSNTPGMGLNAVDDSEQGIKKYIKRNPKTCFIAKDGEKIVGALLSGHDGRRGYIHHTAVDCAYRHKGIGTALVNSAIKALRNEGIQKAALVVFRDNEHGNAFWDKMSFAKRDDLFYRNRFTSEK